MNDDLTFSPVQYSTEERIKGNKTQGFRSIPLTREFDSWISEKVPAGRIKPAFFVSNFLFLSIVFYCNVL